LSRLSDSVIRSFVGLSAMFELIGTRQLRIIKLAAPMTRRLVRSACASNLAGHG
jgi:hypothetical protein